VHRLDGPGGWALLYDKCELAEDGIPAAILGQLQAAIKDVKNAGGTLRSLVLIARKPVSPCPEYPSARSCLFMGLCCGSGLRPRSRPGRRAS
jgi:hypothetical protein